MPREGDFVSMGAPATMIGLTHLEQLRPELTRYFEKLPESMRTRRIAGILFCKQGSVLGTKEIHPNLGYFNYRSGKHVNFYLAGYGLRNRTESGEPLWDHAPLEFNRIREELEQRISWKYSGGTDLILVDIEYQAHTLSAVVDFSTAQTLCLDRLIRSGEIESVEMCIEEIVRYCDEHFDSKTAASTEQAGPLHLRQTLIRKNESNHAEDVERPREGRGVLRTEVNRACRRLEFLNAEMRTTMMLAKAISEQIKEITLPYRERFKDERLTKAREEAKKVGHPELFVEFIVSRILSEEKFPTTDILFKHFSKPILAKRLRDSGHGSSRATFGRWLGEFKQILRNSGFPLTKYRPQRSLLSSRDPANQSIAGTGNEQRESEPMTPEEIIMKDESLRGLSFALKTLPEVLREVIQLHFYEKRSLSDVAAILKTTEKDVESKIARALEIMRKPLSGY